MNKIYVHDIILNSSDKTYKGISVGVIKVKGEI
jgi:hypothetical protein